jgi:hypothetical protein
MLNPGVALSAGLVSLLFFLVCFPTTFAWIWFFKLPPYPICDDYRCTNLLAICGFVLSSISLDYDSSSSSLFLAFISEVTSLPLNASPKLPMYC